METPFEYGRLAVSNNFTNRKKELKHLTDNFSVLANTILISPRRWGKSSLVEKAAGEAAKKDKKLRFCIVDAFSVRTEEQFYEQLATSVLKASSSRMEIVSETAKNFMGKFIPRLSFNPGNQQELILSLDWKEVKKQPDDILNMAEKIAAKNKLKFIICIDEFQNVASFDHQLAFQKKLRANWQKHQHVAYCLYGSKRHMLMDVFTNSSMPFYKFGDLMFIEKIKREDWIGFITRRFSDTKKTISRENAAYLTDLADCHPYYVQQLAQLSWLRTRKDCSEKIINDAYDSLINQLSLLFHSKTEELTIIQINFLRALLEGVNQFSSKETLDVYNLGTSGNVVKLKKTLVNKEIIDIQNNTFYMLDPLYKSWLETRYFKMMK